MSTNETLKSKRDEANKLVNEIIEQSHITVENVKKSNNHLTKIFLDERESKNLNARLKRIIDSTTTAIKQFQTEKDKISKLLTQVNGFYDKKYLPLIEKIEDEHYGFKARLKQGTQFKNEIIKLSDSSKLQYDEVKKYASELKKANKEIISIDNIIRKLHQSSKLKNDEINNFNKHISQLDIKITKIHTNLENLFQQSIASEKSISELLTKSNVEFNKIDEIKSESEKLLKEIQEIYEIAAETGLSGEFDKRRKHLKELLGKWEQHIRLTTIILLGLIILMFVVQLWLYKWNIKEINFDLNFYVRFLITSPVIFYLYFCSLQHSQTQKLHDRYSFKTTLAMSIKHHIQLLTQEDKFLKEASIDKILDFVLDGFQKIYSEPHVNDDYKLKFKLANMEMDIEKKIIETISKSALIKSKS